MIRRKLLAIIYIPLVKGEYKGKTDIRAYDYTQRRSVAALAELRSQPLSVVSGLDFG